MCFESFNLTFQVHQFSSVSVNPIHAVPSQQQVYQLNRCPYEKNDDLHLKKENKKHQKTLNRVKLAEFLDKVIDYTSIEDVKGRLSVLIL